MRNRMARLMNIMEGTAEIIGSPFLYGQNATGSERSTWSALTQAASPAAISVPAPASMGAEAAEKS